MPHRYQPGPAPFERARLFIGRNLFRFSFFIATIGLRLVPKCHPVRIFLEARIPELRSKIISSSVPANRDEIAKIKLTLLGLLIVAGAPIQDALGLIDSVS